MYPVHAMNISEKTAIEAAEWFIRLQEPSTTQVEHAAFQQWRQSDPSHEYAWQRAMEVSCKLSTLPSGLGAATFKASEKINRRTAIKTFALFITGGGMGWQAWHSQPAQMYRADYATAIGKQSEVVLSDGTEIFLNTASAINTRYTNNLRLIEHINGEILIRTGNQDSQHRQMVVHTAFGQLLPLGTQFIVKQAQDYAALSVIEGAVNITTKQGEQSVLHANQQTTFNRHHIEPINAVKANADSWTRGVLSVREMCLADFADELARYRIGVIRCAPEVARLKLSGVFQLKDTDAVLNGLSSILPINVHYLSRYWVTLTAKNH